MTISRQVGSSVSFDWEYIVHYVTALQSIDEIIRVYVKLVLKQTKFVLKNVTVYKTKQRNFVTITALRYRL